MYTYSEKWRRQRTPRYDYTGTPDPYCRDDEPIGDDLRGRHSTEGEKIADGFTLIAMAGDG